MIILIVAMTKFYVIGKGNKLPWKIKEEMKFFKKTTIGNAVLMGRKTFESIGKPLRFRNNIILTKKCFYDISKNKGLLVINNLNKIINKYKFSKKKLFVIGGKTIYYATFADIDYIFLSLIKKNYQGDIIFPIKDFLKFFRLEYQEFYDEFDVLFYKRISNEI